jgi:hypothetical protein
MLTHYTAHNYRNNHYLIHCAKFSPPCLAQLQKAQRWLVALILLAIPPVINMLLINVGTVCQMPESRPTPIAIHSVAEHVYMMEAKF